LNSASGKPLQLEDVEVVAGSGAVSFNRKRFGGQLPQASVKRGRKRRSPRKSAIRGETKR
jgi:hypothetical protein